MPEQKAGPTAPDRLISKSDGRAYWENTEGDVNGMLGGIPAQDGFSSISRIDLQGSRTFLARLGIGTKNDRRTLDSVLEGGAGIGRVTEGLLLRVSECVDIIEPISKFTTSLQTKAGIRTIYNIGLEDWQPSPGRQYDLIWLQWCLGHLTDEQLLLFFIASKAALTPITGLIVVKENINPGGTDLFDDTDSSVTRQDSSFLRIFEEAGFVVVKSELQRGLPETSTQGLFPVKMYAVRPKDRETQESGPF
ncbi:hypothetical protein NOR_04684 [Metarhizium rileyi]|uniref:Alpha N-terminal protein methyltransferase 1 n=1 Tax=Metarhizium rileyi (strain RCEF 4871) TaxID=1649241 RepID=A0A162JIL5_METRR|nr:hypothetical protein NOR_04684 [Metarhizium rileyi RCEF 4871]